MRNLKNFFYLTNLLLILIFAINSWGQTPAGTVIKNKADLEYKNPVGQTVNGSTNEFKLTVNPISIISVKPDAPPIETIPPNSNGTAPFEVCNNGNTSMLASITSVLAGNPGFTINRVYLDADRNGIFSGLDILITVGQTVLPPIENGKCLPISVDYKTGNIAPGTTLSLTLTAATSDPNSNGSDTGTRNYNLNRGAILDFTKTVNNGQNAQVQVGDIVTYGLSMTNKGDADATDLLITDVIQAGTYLSGSLKIDNISKTDNVDSDEAEFVLNKVTARVAKLEKGKTIYVEFKVKITELPNGTTILNIAKSQSPAIPSPPDSNTTITVVNPKGLVFNGEIGINSPVSNAAVTLLDANGQVLNLAGNSSFPTNPTNQNPFQTNGSGNYSFGLPCAGQGTYFLNVTAAGFTNRRIQVNASPNTTSPCVLSYTLKSVDGLPLSDAAGNLSLAPISAMNMAGLFAYIPLFQAGSISVDKSVDSTTAQTGDILNYRVDFTNNSNGAVPNVSMQDTLPRGFYIAENSMEILRNGNRSNLPFTVSEGNIVTANIGTISAHESVSIFYKVKVGADAAKGRNLNIAVATDPSGKPISPGGSAAVEIYPGLDSDRQTLVGRVFIDKNADGIYNLRDGDLPLANAQVVSSTGRAALTDSEGKYSIPTYAAGKLSVGVIRNTIPEGLLPKFHNSEDGDWSRLVHSPLGVGMIQTADFPLVEVSPTQTVDPKDPNNSNEESKNDYLGFILRVKSILPLAGEEVGKIVVNATEQNERSITGKSVINAGVQTKIGNTVSLAVNGVNVPNLMIGEKVLDNKSGMALYVFYNLQLKQGTNLLEAVIYDVNNIEIGRAVKTLIKGGKAVRYEIAPETSKISAGGRDKTSVIVRAYDAEGLPAEDAEVMLTTTGGSFKNTVSSLPPAPNTGSSLMITQNEVVKLQDGSGRVELTSGPKAATANLYLTQGFTTGTSESAIAQGRVDFTEPTPVPTIVGFGEFYWGTANPGTLLAGKMDGREPAFFHGRASLWGRLPLFKGVLTGAYQSNLPLNRDETFDRNLVGRFNFNNPNFDESYSIFGDSSQRYFLAPSNTKGFARWEKDLNFVQFGDFNARQKSVNNSLFNQNGLLNLTNKQPQANLSTGPKLAGYNRNLTGLQIHLEDSKGNLFEIAGARPDTSFGRDIFTPSGLSRIKLTADDILYGSESVTVETRDRRAPELIVRRETLLRDQDYEIDYLAGVIYIKSNLLIFDAELNPNQLVISYEHKADSSSNVILSRGEKTFQNGNYVLGGTFNYTNQAGSHAYTLGGVDFKAKLPNNGSLELEVARSSGTALGFGNNFTNTDSDGLAFLANYSQRFKRVRTNLNFINSQNGFNNPFGGIIQRGSTRVVGQVEVEVTSQDAVRFQGSFDRTKTDNFSNNRESFGAMWKRSWNEKLSTILGYDFRHFSDDSGQFGGNSRNSHLLTAGINWNPTKKLSLSLVREQNLTNDNDPAYPNNTLLQAEYRINQWSKFFAVNRFGGQINPIGDSSQIVAYQSKREFNAGFETKFKQGTSLMSAYRSEDGLNGQENFAITGIGQKFNFRKNWAVDAGYQFAWKLSGQSLVTPQNTFHNIFGGITYAKENAFTANARYEFRSRLGRANLFSTGIAGKLNQDWTMLGKFSFAQADQTFDKSFRKSSFGQIGGALRPKDTDRYGMLFQYQFRNYGYRTNNGFQSKEDLRHYLTADGFYQPDTHWNFFGKTGLRYVSQSENGKSYATWMNILQGRVEYRFDKYFDVGSEARWIQEFKTNSARFGGAVELGYWATPTFRIAGGYNYQQRSSELFSVDKQKGFYLTITTKLDRYFKLFGAEKASGQK